MHSYPSTEWFAGFFDGEGCIGLYWSKGSPDIRYKSGKKNGSWIRSVTIVHTYLPALKLWKKFYGGRIAINRKETSKWKQTYVWSVGSKADIKYVLTDLLPYLIEKKGQAMIMLDGLANVRSHLMTAKMLKRRKHAKLS